MPEQKSRLELQRTFTDQEYQRLFLGLNPEELADKWFVSGERVRNGRSGLRQHLHLNTDIIYPLTECPAGAQKRAPWWVPVMGEVGSQFTFPS